MRPLGRGAREHGAAADNRVAAEADRPRRFLKPRVNREVIPEKRRAEVFNPVLARDPHMLLRHIAFLRPAQRRRVFDRHFFHPPQILAVIHVTKDIDRSLRDHDLLLINCDCHLP